MSKDQVHVAMVGISGRGSGLLGLLLEMEDVRVTGVSDRYPDRLGKAAKQVEDALWKGPCCGQRLPAAAR